MKQIYVVFFFTFWTTVIAQTDQISLLEFNATINSLATHIQKQEYSEQTLNNCYATYAEWEKSADSFWRSLDSLVNQSNTIKTDPMADTGLTILLHLRGIQIIARKDPTAWQEKIASNKTCSLITRLAQQYLAHAQEKNGVHSEQRSALQCAIACT